ncbi:MAG: energy transducer TonB [Lentimicrobiaceae bacterium]|jgi:TonB family protein
MNDRNKKLSVFFMPSGCLTGDALMLFVSGSLKGAAFTKAQKHIAECPLCADAAEGLRMWLKENKPDESPAGLTDSLKPETSRLSENPPYAGAHSNEISLNPVNKFHTRTDILNDRIKQRLHAHAINEAKEKGRLSYKPFVWLAAAASIVLLIGSFYVVWIQNHFDSQKLVKQRASEMAILESQVSSDTLIVSLPENKAVLAIKMNAEKETQKPNQATQPAVIGDAEVFNQVGLNVVSEEAALPETLSAQEVTVMKDELKTITADKANAAPASKNTRTATMKKAEIEDQSIAVFTVVEEMPSFPGGEAERNKFLAENIVYPQQAVENGIQGTVYVSFIVNSDGKIEDVKILRGIGSGCDEEALRVLKMMPPWHPGKQNGRTVRVRYTMPVSFKLN